MELQIDREFESKIPPLTVEEFQQLEENILADGVVISPIIVWNGIIVDGHNRYRIIERHPEIRYSTHEKQFSDRFAVIAWICRNQLGRRNLTPEQKKYLIGKQYEAEKQRQGTNNQYVQAKSEKCQSGTFQKTADTAERIAKENGIGRRTVYRAESFAKAVDIADDVEPGIRANLLAGEIKATEHDFRELIAATPTERSALVEKMRNPPQKRHKVLPERNLLTMEQIAAQMPNEEDKWTPESVFCELDAALDCFIFRWSVCLSHNIDYFSAEEYRLQINLRAKNGQKYLNRILQGDIPLDASDFIPNCAERGEINATNE